MGVSFGVRRPRAATALQRTRLLESLQSFRRSFLEHRQTWFYTINGEERRIIRSSLVLLFSSHIISTRVLYAFSHSRKPYVCIEQRNVLLQFADSQYLQVKTSLRRKLRQPHTHLANQYGVSKSSCCYPVHRRVHRVCQGSWRLWIVLTPISV